MRIVQVWMPTAARKLHRYICRTQISMPTLGCGHYIKATTPLNDVTGSTISFAAVLMTRQSSNRLEESLSVIAVAGSPYPAQDQARGAEMKFANFAKPFVTLGWNPCQIGLAIRIIVPIVTRETGTSREQ